MAVNAFSPEQHERYRKCPVLEVEDLPDDIVLIGPDAYRVGPDQHLVEWHFQPRLNAPQVGRPPIHLLPKVEVRKPPLRPPQPLGTEPPGEPPPARIKHEHPEFEAVLSNVFPMPCPGCRLVEMTNGKAAWLTPDGWLEYIE